MFKSLSLFALLLAGTTSVIGQTAKERTFLDIKTVCKQTPKLGLFGQLLEQRPDIYAVYANQKDSTFYLPSDDALNAYYKATGNIFRRAAADDINKASYQYVNTQVSINDAKEKKRSAQKGGDGKSTMVVSSSTTTTTRKRQLKVEDDTVETAGVTISTGLGAKSDILFGDIQCKQGLIQVVNTLFEIPAASSHSLNYTGLTKFYDATLEAGLATKFDNMANVTIFAPQDKAFGNCTMDPESVGLYVVENKALYSPDLKHGDVIKSISGAKLHVKVEDDVFYINCVKVITTDSIISNGVIHVLEEKLESEHWEEEEEEEKEEY